jgi:transcriptional regulator with XRE-family HTH domain
MDILKKFGQTVKETRLSKGMSQGNLAKKLSVDPSYISQIERGTGNMSLKRIEKLAKALEISISDLLK